MEDRQVRTLISSGFAISVITITAILRCISRRLILGIFLDDDWLMLIGVFFCLIFAIGDFVMVHQGFGRHTEAISLDKLVFIVKMLVCLEIIYHLAVAFIKWSMLVFILRFIPKKTWSRTIGVATIWVLMIYQVITFLTLILQCVPLEKTWNPALPGTCINLEAFFFFGATFNILTDFIIFILPIKWLLNIKRSNTEKVLILCLFGVSFFGCVVGIIRLYSIKIFADSEADATWSIYSLDIWSHVESVIAVICGSAPALKPLFTRARADPRKQSISKMEMSKSFYSLKRRCRATETAVTESTAVQDMTFDAER